MPSNMYYSLDDICYLFTKGVKISKGLTDIQEEADTKLILHASHALRTNNDIR